MGKKAIILGASGLTGSCLLKELLGSNHFEHIVAIVRSPLNLDHTKLQVVQADLFNLTSVAPLFKTDVVFCCIGTTKAKTPDQSQYMKIDKGIPAEAAKISAEQGARQFVVISAMGADKKSRIFFNRVKGEMEDAVLSCDIRHKHILRPSLIGGKRREKRVGEKIAQFLMGTFSWLVPGDYKIIQPETIARAMLNLSLKPGVKQIYKSSEIKQLADYGS